MCTVSTGAAECLRGISLGDRPVMVVLEGRDGLVSDKSRATATVVVAGTPVLIKGLSTEDSRDGSRQRDTPERQGRTLWWCRGGVDGRGPVTVSVGESTPSRTPPKADRYPIDEGPTRHQIAGHGGRRKRDTGRLKNSRGRSGGPPRLCHT